MAETEKRIRGWVISRSWEYDKNDPTSKYHGADEDTWREGVLDEWTALAQKENMDWCHFIFHDIDEVKDENGKITIKPIHAHAVVRFVDGRTQNAVLKDFCGSNQRTQNCEPVDPQKGGFRTALLYLTHQTSSAYNAEKTWYHHSLINQFGKRYLDLIKTDKRDRKASGDIENVASALCEKIGSGELRIGDAKKQFKEQEGAYALTKYKSAFESADEDYKQELILSMQRISALGQFRRQTTYVSGKGRVGKTMLAENMAVALHGPDDVYVPASGGSDKLTDDFIDAYHMQKATVVSDMDLNSHNFKGFLSMFDPYKWSPTKSRNKSKPWLSTDCYIADNRTVGEFIIELITGRPFGELTLSHAAANDLVMGFGRIARIVTYGQNESGDKVVWIGRLKDKFPSLDEVVAYAKNECGNMFNRKIVGVFYDVLGYVPYDESAPIVEDRKRIAKIINAVYGGDMQADGFVPVAQPVLAAV